MPHPHKTAALLACLVAMTAIVPAVCCTTVSADPADVEGCEMDAAHCPMGVLDRDERCEPQPPARVTSIRLAEPAAGPVAVLFFESAPVRGFFFVTAAHPHVRFQNPVGVVQLRI